MGPAVGADDVPGHRQHQTEGQVRHRIGVGPRDVAHGDPQFLGLLQMDIIQARSVLADDLQLGAALHDRLRKLMRADDEGVVVGDHGLKLRLVKVLALHGNFKSGPGEDVQRLIADLAKGPGGNQNFLTHGVLLLSSRFFSVH